MLQILRFFSFHRIRSASIICFGVLFCLPLLCVLAYLFSPDTLMVWQHLGQTFLGTYIFNTVMLCSGVGVLATLLGISAAWITTAYEFPSRSVWAFLLILPLAIPGYIAAYIYTDLLQFVGPVQSFLRTLFPESHLVWPEIRSLGGAICVMGTLLYPYIYLATRLVFAHQIQQNFEVCCSLGVSRYTGFWQVSFPLAKPALMTAIALVVMETLSDFGATSYFGVLTLSTGVYRTWISLGQVTAAGQLASCLLLGVFFIFLLEQSSRRRMHIYTNDETCPPRRRIKLKTGAALCCILFCAGIFLVGFGIPVCRLIWLASQEAPFSNLSILTGPGLNSVLIATLSAALLTLIALLLQSLPTQRFSLKWQIFKQVLRSGYAIPGMVLALGLFEALKASNLLLKPWGLYLTSGAFWILFYAYALRFLGVGVQMIEAGKSKISVHLEQAARLLGCTGWSKLWRLDSVLLRGSIITSGLLIWVDIIKELPATLILRPFNFDTLATHTYSLAQDERLTEASLSAIAIVMVSLIPLYLLFYRKKDKL